MPRKGPLSAVQPTLVLMPEQFAEYLNADRRKHGAEIRKLNIRLD